MRTRIKPISLILLVLLVSAILRIILLFQQQPVWWDSAVYAGMGKSIFSNGNAGLWEPIRPIIWPIILGAGWKIQLDVLLFGKIIELMLSMGSIYLIYLIGRKTFDETTGIIAAILLSFSQIFFWMGFQLYTEIAMVFFILLGIYFMLEEKYFLSGLFFSLGFLTKFPAAIFIAIVLIYLTALCIKKVISFNKIIYFIFGLLAVSVPYLISNKLVYGSILFPLIEAQKAISQVVGCNYLHYNPWTYYFIAILKDNILNIFSLLGIFLVLKNCRATKNNKTNRQTYLLLGCFVAPLVYFTLMHCRDNRYLLIFLPFVILFSAKGIGYLINLLLSIKKKNKNEEKSNNRLRTIAILTILLISIGYALKFYSNSNKESAKWVEGEYYKYLQDKEIKGEVWVGNPQITLWTDYKLNLMYYPVYGTERANWLINYFSKNKEKISYAIFDSCEGGMICNPTDDLCEKTTKELMQKLDQTFKKEYYRKAGRCEYYVFADG